LLQQIETVRCEMAETTRTGDVAACAMSHDSWFSANNPDCIVGSSSSTRTMKTPSFHPLALVPCLLSVAAAPVHAAVTCTPTATPSVVRPGGEIRLRGNCIDTDTNQPVSTGSEVWAFDIGEGSVPVGQRLLPNGELVVNAPQTLGNATYLLPSIDGYGGNIDFNPAFSVTVSVQDAPASQANLDQLTSTLTSLQTSRVRGNLDRAQSHLQQLRAPGATQKRLDVYVSGLGDLLSQDASGSQSEFKSRSTTLSVGVDYRLSDAWVLGGNVGGSRSHVSFAGSQSDQKSTGTQATAYAAWSVTQSAYVSATLSYEASKFELRRDDGSGALSFASPRGRGLGFSLSGGQDFLFGPWSVGPYIRFDRVISSIDAFDESGSASAVSVGAQRTHSDSINIGAQTQFSIPVSWGLVLPYVRAEISQRKDSTREAATARLLSDNTTLLVPVAAELRNKYGTVAVGVSGLHQGGVSWFADVESGFAQDSYRTRRFGLGLRFEL
jgi:uncharacterized protein YhjY with autotransporter beta-barrel domain